MAENGGGEPVTESESEGFISTLSTYNKKTKKSKEASLVENVQGKKTVQG